MNEIGLIVRTEKKYWGIVDKLYKRQKANEPLYYQSELAKELKKSPPAISELVGVLRDIGIVKSENKPGSKGGRVNFISLTDRGVLCHLIFSTPLVTEIIEVIKKIHDSPWKYGLSGSSWEYEGELGDLSELARRASVELGKNPDDKSIMDMIYVVMAMPDVKEHLEKGAIPRVVPLRK